MAGPAVALTVTVEELEETVGSRSRRGQADSTAMLVTDPLSTSVWVVVYAPVQVSDAPGASEGDGQVTEVTLLSDTAMAEMVVVPVLVTR